MEAEEAKEVEELQEVRDRAEEAWAACERGRFCVRNMGNGSSGSTGASIHFHGMVEIEG